MNDCPGKKKNLKPQGSLSVILLFCFPFRTNLSKSFSKVFIQKISKTLVENTGGILQFQLKAISPHIYRMFSWEFLSSTSLGYQRVIASPLLFDVLSFSEFILKYYFRSSFQAFFNSNFVRNIYYVIYADLEI